MRTRLLGVVGGGIIGFLVAFEFPLEASLGLSSALTTTVCTLTGGAIGYLVTLLLDVFEASSER